MKIKLYWILALSFISTIATAQQKYIFYLHGAVVTELGDNAINQSVPEWGPYEYSKILDSLRKRGFVVISEIRKKGLSLDFYVSKIKTQADSLLKRGVPSRNITILGASAGWDIALRVSAVLRNQDVNIVIMGGCWPNTHQEYSTLTLYGNFLSIFEKTDPHGSCMKIFDSRKSLSSHHEIMLNTGLSHGFIYKGYTEWIDPMITWLDTLPVK